MENNKDYITYLNSLHNYNAQNQNAYGEKNAESPYFKDVMVEIGLCNFIVERLKESEPHVIILTGHAGDGKTSIMYQVLEKLGIEFDTNKKSGDIVLPSGMKCRCIKDFSEFTDNEKKDVLDEVLELPSKGQYAFMVTNTGPLINTYGELFESKDEKEKSRIKLINAMDSNGAEIINIRGHKICVINIATVENTYFATKFLDNLIKEMLWKKCYHCEKKSYCHIILNRNLIMKNKKRVFEFIDEHYIWLTEHGKRLTIRSMTEQLAYMITGGQNCKEVQPKEDYKYLFSNLFFGYIGTKSNIMAMNIIAVNEAKICSYDQKRLRTDEKLLIKRNYDELFGIEVSNIIKEAEKKNAYIKGWSEFLRRTYMFMNIITDEEVIKNDSEDIFSRQFRRFMDLRSGNTFPSKQDANIVTDALSMIYTGSINNEQLIPLTLSRESGIAQNVQLITGSISKRKIKIIQTQTKDSLFNENNKRFILKLEINNKVLDSVLTLPMLDYFDDLKNGIISTNIDPQLSHGVESLKAQLSSEMNDIDNDTIEIIILRNNGSQTVCFEITDDNKFRIVA